MYDEILQWGYRSVKHHQFDFNPSQLMTRDCCLQKIKNQLDLNCIDPIKKTIYLEGCKQNVVIVTHDFKSLFYSLLSDENLLTENNLLYDSTNLFELPTKPSSKRDFKIGDVNTGTVWYDACNFYLNRSNQELLCPIIFYIDKTHTDLKRCSCIEQIRFKLGIFKYEVRNRPSSWRTLGYIPDQGNFVYDKAESKLSDYHLMIELILQSYKNCQNDCLGWNLCLGNRTEQVFFRIPVLFLIGDTDNHNKMCGKFSCQSRGVKRLCRYCDCPFEETENPFYEFTLNKLKPIKN